MRENMRNTRRGSRTGSQLLPSKLPFWMGSLVCARSSPFQARALALGSLISSEPTPGVSKTRQVLWSSLVASLTTLKARKLTLATFIELSPLIKFKGSVRKKVRSARRRQAMVSSASPLPPWEGLCSIAVTTSENSIRCCLQSQVFQVSKPVELYFFSERQETRPSYMPVECKPLLPLQDYRTTTLLSSFHHARTGHSKEKREKVERHLGGEHG